MRLFRNILATCALVVPVTLMAGGSVAPQSPATPPDSAQLRYTVDGNIKGIPYSAKSRLDWTNQGTTYNARMEVSVFLLGSRVQTSAGSLGAQGLLPARFTDKSRKERSADFDYPLGRIRFSNNSPQVGLMLGAQDRLSVFMQLAALFKARPDGFRRAEDIPLQVAGTGGAEIWHFQVGDERPLVLPAGTLKARQLTRAPRQGHENDSRVDIWLAPDLDHLPVRIRITEPDGDAVDQRLSQMP